jgi:rsbT antagonist protein RsbS
MAKNDRIPIIEMKGQLLVSVQRELTDVDALALQDDILLRLRETGAHGVILDVSGVEIVDSYIARVFNDVGTSAASMGARTVLVGLRPAVAMTLVEMDVELTRVRSELTLDRALAWLEETAPRAKARLPGADGKDAPPLKPGHAPLAKAAPARALHERAAAPPPKPSS